jgi:hypothetical protein
MPYLTGVSQEQIARGPASGTMRVHWSIGGLVPDVIEIRLAGDAATPATLLASISIDGGAGTSASQDLAFAAPNFISLVVSPRTVEETRPSDAKSLPGHGTLS